MGKDASSAVQTHIYMGLVKFFPRWRFYLLERLDLRKRPRERWKPRKRRPLSSSSFPGDKLAKMTGEKKGRENAINVNQIVQRCEMTDSRTERKSQEELEFKWSRFVTSPSGGDGVFSHDDDEVWREGRPRQHKTIQWHNLDWHGINIPAIAPRHCSSGQGLSLHYLWCWMWSKAPRKDSTWIQQ